MPHPANLDGVFVLVDEKQSLVGAETTLIAAL